MANNFFDEQPTFIYPTIARNQLISMGHNLRIAYLRSYLMDRNIKSVQYIQEQVSNLYDTVDDILSFGNKCILFYIDIQNYYICRSLTSELKKSNPESKIIWIGKYVSMFNEKMFDENEVDVYIGNNIEESVYKLLINKFDKLLELEITQPKFNSLIKNGSYTALNINTMDDCCIEEISSPYKNELIPVQKLTTIDMQADMRSVGSIVEDLDYISSKVAQQGIIVNFLDEDLSGYSYYDNLIDVINEKKYPFNYKCTQSIRKITAEKIEVLKKANFTCLEILVQKNIKAQEFSDLLKILNSHKKNDQIKFSFAFEFSENSSEDVIKKIDKLIKYAFTEFDDIKFINTEKNLKTNYLPGFMRFSSKASSQILDILISKYFHSRNEHEEALLNGFMAFETGIYPLGIADNYVKHIGIEDNMLNEYQYSRLKDYTGLNSAIVAKNCEVTGRVTTDEFYLKGDNVLRYQDDIYNKNILQAQRAGYFLSNFHQLQRSSDSFNIQVNDFYRAKPLQMANIPYSKVDSYQDNIVKFVNFESPEDINKFLENVEYFESTGSYKNKYELKINIVNSCRWGNENMCSFLKLKRFNLGKNNEIRPCNDCSKSIGNLDESYFDVLQKTCVIAENEQVKRRCSSCEVKYTCSKCALLPDSIDTSEFCKIRRKYKVLPYYLYYGMILNNLLINANFLRDVPVNKIKISSEFTTHYFPQELTPGDTVYIENYIMLLTVNKTPIIYNALHGNLMKINEHMALIAEAMFRKLSKSIIISYISENFKINNEEASKVFVQAFQYLNNAGCIQKGVTL
jgi:hypothetical protein